MSRMWDGGYWTAQSLKGLGPQRRLPDCNIEEVAAHFRLGTSGLQFDGSAENKSEARGLILDLFGPDRHPGKIRVLTMPGRDWTFETELIIRRERAGGCAQSLMRGPRPWRTKIHSVENDRAVYYHALATVPGMHHRFNVIRDVGGTSYAERVLRYYWINRYIFGNVDDLMPNADRTYNCVWLDYFGPLSLERLAIIKRFFETKVTGTLVITSLKARWTRAVSTALCAFDGYEAWLRHEFSEYPVEHYVEYFDTSPMVQFAVSKPSIVQHS